MLQDRNRNWVSVLVKIKRVWSPCLEDIFEISSTNNNYCRKVTCYYFLHYLQGWESSKLWRTWRQVDQAHFTFWAIGHSINTLTIFYPIFTTYPPWMYNCGRFTCYLLFFQVTKMNLLPTNLTAFSCSRSYWMPPQIWWNTSDYLITYLVAYDVNFSSCPQ